MLDTEGEEAGLLGELGEGEVLPGQDPHLQVLEELVGAGAVDVCEADDLGVEPAQAGPLLCVDEVVLAQPARGLDPVRELAQPVVEHHHVDVLRYLHLLVHPPFYCASQQQRLQESSRRRPPQHLQAVQVVLVSPFPLHRLHRVHAVDEAVDLPSQDRVDDRPAPRVEGLQLALLIAQESVDVIVEDDEVFELFKLFELEVGGGFEEGVRCAQTAVDLNPDKDKKTEDDRGDAGRDLRYQNIGDPAQHSLHHVKGPDLVAQGPMAPLEQGQPPRPDQGLLPQQPHPHSPHHHQGHLPQQNVADYVVGRLVGTHLRPALQVEHEHGHHEGHAHGEEDAHDEGVEPVGPGAVFAALDGDCEGAEDDPAVAEDAAVGHGETLGDYERRGHINITTLDASGADTLFMIFTKESTSLPSLPRPPSKHSPPRLRSRLSRLRAEDQRCSTLLDLQYSRAVRQLEAEVERREAQRYQQVQAADLEMSRAERHAKLQAQLETSKAKQIQVYYKSLLAKEDQAQKLQRAREEKAELRRFCELQKKRILRVNRFKRDSLRKRKATRRILRAPSRGGDWRRLGYSLVEQEQPLQLRQAELARRVHQQKRLLERARSLAREEWKEQDGGERARGQRALLWLMREASFRKRFSQGQRGFGQ